MSGAASLQFSSVAQGLITPPRSAKNMFAIRSKIRAWAVSAAAIIGFSGVASAAPLFFFGEDPNAGGSLPVPNSVAAQSNFLSHLVGVHTEDFSGIPAGTQFPFDITFGLDTATLSGTNNVGNTGVQNTPIAGRFAIAGPNYLNVGTADALSFTLTFSTPQAAFGFFATDIGDFMGQLTLVFDGGAPIDVPHTINAPDGAGLFWGIIDVDNPFTTVQFSNTVGAADAFGFDLFTIGRVEQVRIPVNEPAMLALLGLGLLAIGVARRRRK
jgi:hypothetical protein